MEALQITPITAAQIVGYSSWGIEWQMSSTMPITAQDALKAQERAGYHSLGYGFYRYRLSEQIPGLYVANWCCARSAD